MRVKLFPRLATLSLTSAETDSWCVANKEYLSAIRNKRIKVLFGPNGILAIKVNGRRTAEHPEWPGAIIYNGREISLMVRDYFADTLPENHPCWETIIGRFEIPF